MKTFNYLQKNAIVNKKSNSLKMEIRQNENINIVFARNPKEENTNFEFLFPLIILGSILIAAALTSNEDFEKLVKS